MISFHDGTHRYIRWVFVIVKFSVWNYDKGMDTDKVFYKNKKFEFFCNESAL